VWPRSPAAQAADWADILRACRDDAVALIESGAVSGDVRHALGAARQALRDPAALLSALIEFKKVLSRQYIALYLEDRVEVG
ncbi:MAG: hypothetical protein ACREPP_09375, partial [Rhodanobacteraceae bacterium]